MNPDGHLLLKFKDGTSQYFLFKNIRHHGIVQSYVRIEGEVKPEGPLMYTINYYWGRREFPWDTIKEVYIHGNSDEYVEWERTQDKADVPAD